jgi:RNA polymerase sigma-70 factor (ECF subfamily)
MWLPEPEMTDPSATPEGVRERADDVSVAFLMLLERLTPASTRSVPVARGLRRGL